MSMRRLPLFLSLPLAFALAADLSAQELPKEVVLPPENVRFDYAQVLAVQPLYQVLRTTRVERLCSVRPAAVSSALSRIVNVVRDGLDSSEQRKAERDAGLNCRTVKVPEEHRRVIAYDVDYMYRGSKFRTRMDRDPGNRLRIRISITPQPMP